MDKKINKILKAEIKRQKEGTPTIGPKMERIALVAEPKRIMVSYDQIKAFQAKTDYGCHLTTPREQVVVNKNTPCWC